MRNVTLAIAVLAAIAFVLPVIPASAENAIVIRSDRDHDRDWQRHRHHKKIAVLTTHRYRDHGRHHYRDRDND